MSLKDVLTSKQEQVYLSYLSNDWTMLILNGAVRSGKTFINNFLFLSELKRVKRRAEKLGISHPQYILAGYSAGSIRDNVITSIENQFELPMKTDRNGHYNLFGVDIVPAYTGNIRGTDKIRGMTSFGAYVNEASLAVESVFVEIVNRCSIEDARIICDTNPDSPEHWLKKNYIDKQDDPKAKTKCFSFTIDDNPTLDKGYVSSLKARLPKGMYYDRAIKGLWVMGEGVVYADFDKQKMLVDKVPDSLHYYVGVDWGFEHKNSILVFGDDDKGNTYLVEEHTAKHKYIDYWVQVAKDIQDRYGHNINFWCDSARPEHVKRFVTEHIHAKNADKRILPGIESVAELMTTGHFFVFKSAVHDFLDEIYQYVWDEHSGEPRKEHDDVMDAMRYAIYSQHNAKNATFIKNTIF